LKSDWAARASTAIPEPAAKPIMLEGDHGAIAYGNIYVRLLRPLSQQ